MKPEVMMDLNVPVSKSQDFSLILIMTVLRLSECTDYPNVEVKAPLEPTTLLTQRFLPLENWLLYIKDVSSTVTLSFLAGRHSKYFRSIFISRQYQRKILPQRNMSLVIA